MPPIDAKDPIIADILSRLTFVENRIGGPSIVVEETSPPLALRINIATEASLSDVIAAMRTVDEDMKSDPFFPADGKFIPNATSPVMPWGAGPRPEGFVADLVPTSTSIVEKDAAPDLVVDAVADSAPTVIVEKAPKAPKAKKDPTATEPSA